MIRTLPRTSEMRKALMGRDAAYDGIFYACVSSTGIFCRPSCPARKPKPDHVRFHGSVLECLLDGFRPCKRCRPLAVERQDRAWLDNLLEHVEKAPTGKITDADLAGWGVSPYRARRYFQRNFQMTFQTYYRARRMGVALQQLRDGENSVAVAYDQGYESLSGFRDAFKRVFGTTPGKAERLRCIHTRRIETPIGSLVAGAVDEGLCFLEFADRRGFIKQQETLRRRLGAVVVPGQHELLRQIEFELAEYFAGTRHEFTVPVFAPGSAFQEQVWEALRTIPFGETTSYSALARQIGRPKAVRAVGRANGENRLAIVIPCHRVVREDGSLCGYGGGRWRKQFLLDLERGSLIRDDRQSVPRIQNIARTRCP